MRVNRENLLRCLESVASGLAQREIIEQSGCFVFKDGKVMTFNDEIACTNSSPLNIQGAVRAKPILDLLSKLPDEDLDVLIGNGCLEVRGSAKTRKSGIVMESQVMLPVENVDVPEDWKDLNPDFCDAVKMVYDCASTEESQFIFCCVHITPNFLETSDKFQIARYMIETGIEKPILIRAGSIKHIIGLGVSQFAETGGWIHFRNAAGLVISVRRHTEPYLDFTPHLVPDNTEPVTLPSGLEEVVERSQVFSREDAHGNFVKVNLKSDKVIIEGLGPSGWYKEVKKVTYKGEPIKFTIAPKLLVEIGKKSNECRIGKGRLFVDSGKLKYATVTEVADEKNGEE